MGVLGHGALGVVVVGADPGPLRTLLPPKMTDPRRSGLDTFLLSGTRRKVSMCDPQDVPGDSRLLLLLPFTLKVVLKLPTPAKEVYPPPPSSFPSKPGHTTESGH